VTDQLPANTLPLTIAGKEEIARGIFSFDLRDPQGAALPPFTAGAHITLRTPGGFIRKYSMCSDPAEREHYTVAIKREQPSRGGSVDLIDNAEVGDTLTVAPPVNDFPLPQRATDHIFIAGGIGITPFMAMIRELRAQPEKRFRLFYCTRSPEMTAFLSELSVPELKAKVTIHHDEGDPSRSLDLWPIVEERKNREHLYCCGPRPLMQAVRDLTGHWSSAAVHFEAFSEPERARADDKPFIVELAKSGASIEVPVGVTILEAMRARGYDVPSSCESGTCGTCRAKLIAGEADHRDLVLAEHERSGAIMLCVSRAKSEKLLIDR